MKKLFYILMLMMFIAGCDSVTARGRHGSITINDPYPYRSGRANGRALGHKTHKKHTNLYYNVKVNSGIYLEF